jgi:threonine/homoserine/homoserine lactone efflux protein
MLNSMIEAFILGIIGGAVPGPILTGTFTEILNSGFVKGLRVVFYALLAETIGALLALYVIYSIGLSDIVIKIISIGGTIVLCWLAYQVWKITEINTENKTILTIPKIVILTALNSGYWIFWITVGIPKALNFDKIVYAGKLIFLGTFELAWLITTIFLAFVFFKFKPLLHRKNLIGTTFKILALVLVLLAIKTLLNIF